jgi:hypothetical protein
VLGISAIGVGNVGGVRVSDTGLDTSSGRVEESNSSGFGGGPREFASHGAVHRKRAHGAAPQTGSTRVWKKKSKLVIS